MTTRVTKAQLAAEIDRLIAELESCEARNIDLAAERDELIDMVGALKDGQFDAAAKEIEKLQDQVASLEIERDDLAENEALARETIVEQAKRIDSLTAHVDGDQASTAIDFLAKCEANPVRMGLKLIRKRFHDALPPKHGNREPRAFAIHRLLDEIASDAFMQTRWNQNYLDQQRGRLKELIEQQDGSEVPTQNLRWQEEVVAWNEDLTGLWEELLKETRALFVQQHGREWKPNPKLLKPRTPVRTAAPEVTGREVIDAMKEKTSVAEL